MRPGLVSITFRQLLVDEIILLCQQSRLETIEWGGDAHVPHGDDVMAQSVGEATRNAGLAVSAYGSYYRLGSSEEEDGLHFSDVLSAARVLGAPAIRVWAGKRSSADADAVWRRTVAAEALRIADMAAKHDIKICYEFHSNTLTDTNESAMELLEATQHPNIFTLWQPMNGRTVEECLAGLRQMLPRIHHVHVFHWWPDSKSRLPLAEGIDRWSKYFAKLKQAGRPMDALLEFMPGNSPLILQQEAKTLRTLIA